MVDQITARTECMDAQAHLRLHAISIGFVTDQRPMRAGEQIKQTPGWPPSPSMGASAARSPRIVQKFERSSGGIGLGAEHLWCVVSQLYRQ